MVVIFDYILYVIIFMITPILLIGLFFVSLWNLIEDIKYIKRNNK